MFTGDPSVLEATVIGVPDDKWGEVVVAYVQPRLGCVVDPDALKARCASSLSGYKRSTSLIVLDAIPKNAVGKIDKAALRAGHATAAAGSSESASTQNRGQPQDRAC